MLPTVFAHMGDMRGDVVLVDNDSHDGVADMVAAEFPGVRVVASANHGYGHAINRGVMTCNARYILFLNPDTEILEGSFAELVHVMDQKPSVGLVGCRQVMRNGRLDPTIRYFPNASRALGDALLAEQLGARRPRWLGERELDLRAYEQEFSCDWTVGSFMLVRREALESAGYFDERFFMYSDETDLCRRIKMAGWEIRHLAQMTILHHDAKAGVKPHIESLGAVSRVRYVRKYFSPAHRAAFVAVLTLRHALRAVYAGRGESGRLKRVASREVVATMVGRRPVPFAAVTSPVSLRAADPGLRDAANQLDEDGSRVTLA
jgi:hypothetical protein